VSVGKRHSLLGWEHLGWSECSERMEWSLRPCSGAMELPRGMVALELYSSDKRRGCSSQKDHVSGRGSI